VGVIVQRDDGCGTEVKGNDSDRWSSNGMVLWLGRRQNRDVVEWWGLTKVEMTFLQQWRVGVGWSREGGRRRWCVLIALVSAREGRRRDEALPEDEAEAAISSWLNLKEA
jgi:hypothetical protein